MFTRIAAEFESVDMADLASKRLKESQGSSIKKAGVNSNLTAQRAKTLKHGRHYAVIPTGLTSGVNNTFFTATIDSETTEDVIKEPFRNEKATLYIVCDEDNKHNIKSTITAMGGRVL